jgi:hypothetical protein
MGAGSVSLGVQTNKHATGRAFTLVEAAAAAGVLAVVVALLLPVGERSRRMGQVGEDMSHLRAIAGLTGSYAADYQELVWSYSWQGGVAPQTQYPDLNIVPSSDVEAAQLQFTYLMRTVAGREGMPIVQGLFVYSQNSHLVLAGYSGIELPSRMFTASGDHRRRWADDPAGYEAGLYSPNLGVGGGANIRHPYGSSLSMGTCFYDRSTAGNRVAPQDTRILIVNSAGDLWPKPLTQVAHPSQKAFLHDRVARYFGPRVAWHTMLESKLPVLMCDGSARVRDFGRESNQGANPNTGASLFLGYNPTPIEPPVGGPNSQVSKAGPMWTRAALAGRDFGGPEVTP